MTAIATASERTLFIANLSIHWLRHRQLVSRADRYYIFDGGKSIFAAKTLRFFGQGFTQSSHRRDPVPQSHSPVRR